jgi:hypothetical protein
MGPIHCHILQWATVLAQQIRMLVHVRCRAHQIITYNRTHTWCRHPQNGWLSACHDPNYNLELVTLSFYWFTTLAPRFHATCTVFTTRPTLCHNLTMLTWQGWYVCIPEQYHTWLRRCSWCNIEGTRWGKTPVYPPRWPWLIHDHMRHAATKKKMNNVEDLQRYSLVWFTYQDCIVTDMVCTHNRTVKILSCAFWILSM